MKSARYYTKVHFANRVNNILKQIHRNQSFCNHLAGDDKSPSACIIFLYLQFSNLTWNRYKYIIFIK